MATARRKRRRTSAACFVNGPCHRQHSAWHDVGPASPGLDQSDGAFAENVAIAAATINVHRELLHVEGLVAAGRTEDPYSNDTGFLAQQQRAMSNFEDRLRSVVRLIGRLPFSAEDRVFHWVAKNPSGAAMDAQRAAVAIEDALDSWLVDPVSSPTSLHVTARADGSLRLSLPG